MCTRLNARAALAWMVSCLPGRLLHLAVVPVTEASKEVCNKVTQSPALNMDTRSCNLALGTNPPRGGRNSNNLGSKKNSSSNFLHAVISCVTIQNLLQTHLQTSPEHALHEIGDCLHDLCSNFENLS